jgi:hypothetical protein
MRNRPGEAARQELRKAWIGITKRNADLIGIAIGVGMVAGVAIQLLPGPEWVHAYEFGLLTAGVPGAIAWSLYLGLGKHTLNLGKMGEELTADAVWGWRRRLKGWRLINGLSFRGIGDVDHILVGPGGVFAIESKYTTVHWKVDECGIHGPDRDPVVQARLGRRKVESTLRTGKDRFEIPVQPVVVIWGPGCPDIRCGSVIVNEVIVAEGYRRKMWLPDLDRNPLSRKTVRAVAKKLESELASRVR